MFFEKQGREGLIPKKVSETVRPKQGQTYQRLTTVYVKPEVPDFVNDWLKDFDAQVPVYLVGGSVRDSILGKAPKDIDVITFKPKEDIETKLKTSDTKFYQGGKNLPNLVTANLGENQLIDIISVDGDIESELVRRDFTINAMAQRPDGEIIDPFGGRQDLKNGVLKSPKGDSDKVFSEDPIRMLRAARFIGDLNLKADSSLTDSLKKQKDLLADMPKERIGMEFGRIMYSKDPVSALKFLKENDLLKYIDPALQRTVGFVQNLEGHDYDTWNHTLKSLEHHLPKDKKYPDLATRLGILYHNVGKPSAANENNSDFKNYENIGAQIVEESLNNLRFPSDMVDLVRKLVQHHTSPKTAKTEGDHRRVQLKLRDDLNKLNYVATAHEVGKEGNVNANTDHIVSFQDRIDKLDPIDVEDDRVNLSPLTGKEIMDELDIVPNRKGGGERIGKIKDFLNQLVIEGELKQSDKKGAINRARQYHSTFTQKSNNLLKGWLGLLKQEGADRDVTSDAFADHKEGPDGLKWSDTGAVTDQAAADLHASKWKQERLAMGLVPIPITDKNGIKRTYWCKKGFEDKMVKDPSSPNVGMVSLEHHHGTNSGKELFEKFKTPNLDAKTGEHKKNKKGELMYKHTLKLPHPKDDAHGKHLHFTGKDKQGKELESGIKTHYLDNLHISHDPWAVYSMKGTSTNPDPDEFGKSKKELGEGYHDDQMKDIKWREKRGQLRALYLKKDVLNDRLEKEYKSDTPDPRAVVTGLMWKTGIRVGNSTDSKEAEKDGQDAKSFGASSLKVNHVTVKGDEISYEFPGKKGTIQIGKFNDASLAKAITKLKDTQAKAGKSFLFEREDGKFYKESDIQKWHNGVMNIHESNNIINHNFRHAVATDLALEDMNTFMNQPGVTKIINEQGKLPITTAKDWQDFRNRVGLRAAKQLNHRAGDQNVLDPKTTIASYIDPQVFQHKDKDGKIVKLMDQVDSENNRISKEYKAFIREVTGLDKINLGDPPDSIIKKAYDGKEFDPTRKKEKDIDTYFDNRKDKAEDRDLGLDKIPPHMRPRPKYYEAKFAKTWVEDLAEKGYQSPMIKSSNDEGTKIWFIDGGVDYVASVGATGIGYIEKATFRPLASNATNKISYDPTGNNMRKPNDNEEDLYEEE